MTNEIGLVALDRENKYLQKNLSNALNKTMQDNNFILGEAVTRFEHDFSQYCQTKYAVGVGNGLDALSIALQTLGVGVGDEVIVPANSFIASALAVSIVGAKPIFADCNEENFLIDIERLSTYVTLKTKAIIPVHLHGMPVDMEKMMVFAKKNNLFVVEDCAQAHGATFKGKKVGSFGDISAFSFYPTKNLGCLGDGGCLTTNNKKLMEKAKALRNYGSNGNKKFEIIGKNSRLDSLQATFLSIKLTHLDLWNSKRDELSKKYCSMLRGVKELILPYSEVNATAVWHLYVVRCADGSRDKLQKYLKKHKIQTGIHYDTSIDNTKAYMQTTDCEISKKNARKILSLPMHPFIKKSEVEFVCNTIKKFYS